MLATGYPAFDVFFSALYVAVLIFWMILVFHIVMDVFRSHDLSGFAKALWVLFILVLPLIGCLIYLIARGGKMYLHDVQRVQERQKEFEDYVRKIANTKE